ncbi:MAG: hypothetical protein A3G49_06250 [Candidatus Sungbacteria bacterium RIFCSPLOWO2_12_FULL_41_11]|uniref:Cell division protein FtsX n=1 Tax=Candidatus Sungbacteria bacterium RIFCSPLOWO2_12_FULL_41_11 TaxID=1802286 RepID=A0A1G2LQY7_9BACT|nr:MAG: hypothetical protein UV01_C0004G0099 [Parcubacteria group bacterium GW2011_GWA2_42_14]OGZ97974.1 MAG: hypothetical protein A3D41_04550 [Candidatus Sungbacteria bacterium RIFCSPHIGHO2_02_FULL_41_12b]OHA14035.1 MAG: hypothetical protein A3G49_06250 [Candidatus Sungbacteria bacterium RIFCSPLOWO2_12_FULL_41_11]
MLKSSWLSFSRNGWLSTATILVMTLALFVIGGLMLAGVLSQVVLGELEDKIDIAVYFYPNSSEVDIFNIKDSIAALPEVKEVTYISQEQALLEFKERHKTDQVILGSLEELDGNPLEATINIKTKDPSRFADIAGFIKDKKYPIVDKINYFENQVVIDKLSNIMSSVRNTGLGIILVLALVAVLVAFNTVRIAIWSAREEINIMRLVGASSWFVRGPFIFEGVIHGVTSGGLASLLFYPALWVLSPKLLVVVPSIDLYAYFQNNFLQFAGILMGTGVVLGVFSSFIAIRKYLKV